MSDKALAQWHLLLEKLEINKGETGSPSPQKFGRLRFTASTNSIRISGERGLGGEGKTLDGGGRLTNIVENYPMLNTVVESQSSSPPNPLLLVNSVNP